MELYLALVYVCPAFVCVQEAITWGHTDWTTSSFFPSQNKYHLLFIFTLIQSDKKEYPWLYLGVCPLINCSVSRNILFQNVFMTMSLEIWYFDTHVNWIWILSCFFCDMEKIEVKMGRGTWERLQLKKFATFRTFPRSCARV